MRWGKYLTANFSLSNDDHGGTIITDRHHWSVLLQARHWLRMCKR